MKTKCAGRYRASLELANGGSVSRQGFESVAEAAVIAKDMLANWQAPSVQQRAVRAVVECGEKTVKTVWRE